MKRPLYAGLTARFDYQVPENRTVPHLLPEAPPFATMPHVLATGFLVGLVEWTCIQAIDGCLGEGERTVGVHVDLSHEAPTLPGSTVRFEVELTEAKGRQLTFSVHAAEQDGTVVCRGTHQRAVIDLERFEAKVRARHTPIEAGWTSIHQDDGSRTTAPSRPGQSETAPAAPADRRHV